MRHAFYHRKHLSKMQKWKCKKSYYFRLYVQRYSFCFASRKLWKSSSYLLYFPKPLTFLQKKLFIIFWPNFFWPKPFCGTSI